MSRKEFWKPRCRVICNPGKHVSEPCLRVDAIELGGRDQGIHRCGAVAAAGNGKLRAALLNQWLREMRSPT